MDTPDRNLICTPISKFEDSPVFNYLNSLSPIKPVKSVNIQTFNSLSFSSPPSVFTSPHASNQKESRFLKRHYFSDSTKSGLSSENGNEGSTSVTVVGADQVFNCSGGPPESFESGNVISEVTVDPPNHNVEAPVELPRTLKFDCGSPDGKSTPCDGFETDKALVPFVQEVKVERRGSLESATGLEGICHLEQDKEDGAGSDWENMISAPADELVFDPSNDTEASKEQASQNNHDVLPKTEPAAQVSFCTLNEMEDPATQSEEGGEQMEIDDTPHELPSTFQTPSEKMDVEAGNCMPFGKQQRGTRRRCLVFEMVGAHKRNLEDDSKSSSILSQSNGKFASEDKQMVPFRAGTSSSPCVLPGIGLHLNALAATTKDPRVVKHETLPSGRQLISLPGRISPFHSVVPEQKPLNKTLDLNSLERDTGPAGSEVQFIQDACRSSAFGVREEFNESSSPKKKRRRLEPDVESESCKRCNCKKSKCLKLYCECFAAGVYCVEPCSCQDCFNKPIHEDTVLATRKQIESRNPLAFAPKVIRANESTPEEPSKTPASARHKRGCNCKKSSCLKKYCECYQGGVGCSINCRCEGCKNAFGRKDGTVPTGAEEAEQDEEAETCEKSNVHKGLHISESQKENDEHYQDHVMPITPFQICRMSVQLEFSSVGKPPRPSMFPVGSSPRSHSNRAPKISEILPTPLKLEDHFQVLPDDETPEILRSDCSPIRAVKTSSPNRKRVSPPHREHALSPGRRNSRKLILQSIPAFPSLAYHEPGEQQ